MTAALPSKFQVYGGTHGGLDPAPRRSIYVIGSLRNPRVLEVGRALRDAGWDAFDDWYAAGPEADDHWQKYEQQRGHSYVEALQGYTAKHVFAFDLKHLRRCDCSVLVLPAGRSAHLELGWVLGQGKPGYVLLDGEPERYDQMYQFADKVFVSIEDMLKELKP